MRTITIKHNGKIETYIINGCLIDVVNDGEWKYQSGNTVFRTLTEAKKWANRKLLAKNNFAFEA